MGDTIDAEKEKKRKKALRRMGKIVAKAWQLPNSEPFHSAAAANATSSGSILCLTAVGKKVDDEGYRHGKHGWEEFARDIGGVYNRHIRRKTKHAKLAASHLSEVCKALAEKDQILVNAAENHVPEEPPAPRENNTSRKRKASHANNGDSPKPKKVTKGKQDGRQTTQGAEKEKAMEELSLYVEEQGGDRRSVEDFVCKINRKNSNVTYYNAQGRSFRSKADVAKHLNLIASTARSAAGRKSATIKKRPTTSRVSETEKKKLRKELEKLRKQHNKATKNLNDFLSEEAEKRYPVEDLLLQEEDREAGVKGETIDRTNCASAKVPDVVSFDGIPKHCMADIMVAWDFLCTFSRVINVNPISLDDFLQCLTYKPPHQLADSDGLSTPPVYLGEAHLGLMKLLLLDPGSDDWWWSILETDQTENAVADFGDAAAKDESDIPLIKVDFAALLRETEDPLITTSWLQNLDNVNKIKDSDEIGLKNAVKMAMSVVANKWVFAYLKKALKLGKTSGGTFMKRAVVWLADRVNAARPDLSGKSSSKDAIFKQRAKIVEEVSQQMEKVSSAALAVTDDDIASDAEDSDDDSDDSDDEEDKQELTDDKAGAQVAVVDDDRPASYIPKKPLPSLVDLLLPPGKPLPPTDLLNPVSWPYLAGAAACRILHRYKRLRNEVDDILRQKNGLPQLTVKERREREKLSSGRVFSEFMSIEEEAGHMDRAVSHLCSGGDYLDLEPIERLCILRVMIDAAYDSLHVHDVVVTNYKQRTSATKALEAEQRKAKKEAREKAAEDDAIARQELALDAQRDFIEEKREEILKQNVGVLTAKDVDALTQEEILNYDADWDADFANLPGPGSFKKAEVVAKVAKIQEAAAFETETLTVYTMEELLKSEEDAVAAMEEELEELGGEDALLDSELDRHTARSIDRLRRELGKIHASTDTLPIQREAAIEALQEAIADGTIKSLRSAIRIAKSARLFGPDEETNGVWALDVVRDAHMELENAKNLKKVADAKKDLISKLNKCFIRTEPLGMDRFRNRFWRFENGEEGHVWVEADYVLKETDPDATNKDGFLSLVSDVANVAVGPTDVEGDIVPSVTDVEKFKQFTGQEYHPSGGVTSLAAKFWGCHVNETSIRALIKALDSRGVREDQLKNQLKEAIEAKTASTDGGKEAQEGIEQKNSGDAEEDEDEDGGKFDSSGDGQVFQQAKESIGESESDIVQPELLEGLESGIGQDVRVRKVVETSRDGEVARYEVASIKGWKIRKEDVPYEPDGDEFEPQTRLVETPIWCAVTEKGTETWLTGPELLASICRYLRWKRKDPHYFEPDSTFLAYRNGAGRHCGKAADAALAMTPAKFALYMVKKEAELYQKLRYCVHDNSWGGKNATRNAWVASMKDFAFDLQSVRDGLLNLESAFMELITGNSVAENNEDLPSGKAMLDDPATREDIELESLEKGIKGLWNSPGSRAVFREIMTNSKTVGILALGFELLVRNTRAFINANTVKGQAVQDYSMHQETNDHPAPTVRTTRRMNAWQQQQQQQQLDDSLYYEAPTTRASRRMNAWQQANQGWD